MNQRQQERAWDNEVATLTSIMELELKGAKPDLTEAELKRDAKQAAIGILMIGTLPDYALQLAARHVRMDLRRRGLE
jgi:hypothetical protein